MGSQNDIKMFLDSGKIIYLSDGRQVSGVSRILPVKTRAYEQVVFQQGRPILDSELNLIQNIMTNKMYEMSNSTIYNGWTEEAPLGVDSTDASRAIFSAFSYLFNGSIIRFDDGNGTVTINMGPKIQQSDRNDTIIAYVYREEVAAPGENNRLREQMKMYGNLNGANIANDMIDPAIPDNLPTTRRVQLSYRIVTLTGTDLNKIPVLNTDGQILNGYSFNYGDSPQGFQRGGNGDTTSCNEIGSVDGYVYAIPLFRVYRTSNDTGLDANRLSPLINKMRLKIGRVPATSVDVSNNLDLGISGLDLQAVLENNGRGMSDMLDIMLGCCRGILDGQRLVNAKIEALYNDLEVNTNADNGGSATPPPSSGASGGDTTSTPPADSGSTGGDVDDPNTETPTQEQDT